MNGGLWPGGNYCILQHGESCPMGMFGLKTLNWFQYTKYFYYFMARIYSANLKSLRMHTESLRQVMRYQ